MNSKDLETKIRDLEKDTNRNNYTALYNLQYEASKLHIEIINDFNEKTEIYNRSLLIFTVVISILTAVMAYPILKSIEIVKSSVIMGNIIDIAYLIISLGCILYLFLRPVIWIIRIIKKKLCKNAIAS